MGTTEIRKNHSGQKELSEQSHEAATLNLHETVWGEARLRNREQGEDRQSGMVLSVAEVAETQRSSLRPATPAKIMISRHGKHW